MSLIVLAFVQMITLPEPRPVPRDDFGLFGVCVEAAGDLDGDRVPDLWVGDPNYWGGVVWAVSGKDGSTLRRFDSPPHESGFGWNLAVVGDIDGDGVSDVAITSRRDLAAPEVVVPSPTSYESVVRVHSAATGSPLLEIHGPGDHAKVMWYSSFAGPSLAAVGDWNDDCVDDFAIGWAYADTEYEDCGRIDVVSGSDGATLCTWHGLGSGDRLGYALIELPDLDGDGRRDLAASAVPGLSKYNRSCYSPVNPWPGYVLVLSSRGGALRQIRPYDESAMFGGSLALYADADDGPQILVGQPHDEKRKTSVTRWRLSDGALLQSVTRPSLAAWPDVHTQPGEQSTCESLATRLIAIPDRDGDGHPDIFATTPEYMQLVPAGVISSATSAPIGRAEFGCADEFSSHLGISSCNAGDIDGDRVDDYAVSGSSVRGITVGTVVVISGRTLKAIRCFTRAGRE